MCLGYKDFCKLALDVDWMLGAAGVYCIVSTAASTLAVWTRLLGLASTPRIGPPRLDLRVNDLCLEQKHAECEHLLFFLTLKRA